MRRSRCLGRSVPVPFGLNGDAVAPAPSSECSNSEGIGDAGAPPDTGEASADDVDSDAVDVVSIGTATLPPLLPVLLALEPPPLASLIAAKERKEKKEIKINEQKKKKKTKTKNQSNVLKK
jgi:hypothetical protein